MSDCNPMGCGMPGFSVHHYLLEVLKIMSTESMILFNYLILCCPLPLLPSIFPSIRVFSNEFFLLGGHSIGALASASVLPMNIQGWFPLELIVLISLQSKGLSRVYSSNSVWKYPFFGSQHSLCFNSHPYMTNGKIIVLTIQTFVGKVMSLPFNMLSMFAIDILPRNKHVLNSWLHSLFTVILESMKIKSASASHFSLLFAMKW